MISELSFLIELLLKHKLPPATKSLIAARIAEVEERYGSNQVQAPVSGPKSPAVAMQSPSMQAIMARNPDLIPAAVPVEAIAQTPAAAAALASRQQAIAQAMSGKPEKGQTSPRKF